MRPIPIGIDNFYDMITKNCEYIDKTMFIEEILKEKQTVRLFLRPRRFGKTLMLSMLESYLSIQEKEKNKDLFKGLAISDSDERTKSFQGNCPVINISLKDLKAETWEENLERLKNLISNIYRQNRFLYEKLYKDEQKYFDKILNKEASKIEIEVSLFRLTKMLSKYYDKKVVVLIDEYDTVYENSYAKGFYTECKDTISGLLGSTLKTNEYLDFSVMIGILRISKESILSELNNLNVLTVTNKQFSEYFGFTEKEVENLLEEYNAGEKKEEVAKWYNGYKFGENRIYNPWSVLMYISRDREISNYWVNTGSNRVLSKLIIGANQEVLEVLWDLIKGKNVQITYTENVIYKYMKFNTNTLVSFLLMAGYVTEADEKIEGLNKMMIRVPNYEVRTALESMIQGMYDEIGVSTYLTQFRNSLLKNDKEFMQDALQELLDRSIGSFDNVESFYHGMVFGIMLQLGDEYIVNSNQQAGNRKI